MELFKVILLIIAFVLVDNCVAQTHSRIGGSGSNTRSSITNSKSTNTLDEDLVLINEAPDKRIYVSNKSIKKVNDYSESYIKVWVKTEYDKPTSNKESYTMVLFYVKCDKDQMAIKNSTSYDSNGSVIDTFKIPDYLEDYTDVVPNSVGEAILEYVCNY